MTQTSWHASVTFADVPAGPLTDEQADALADAGGYTIATIAEGTLRLELTVEAGSLATAASAALRQARTAYANAYQYQAQGKPTGLRVVTEEQHLGEIAHPPAEELMGYQEIGQLLDVSRQRAQQLSQRDDFPAPIAALAMGSVYTRASVEAWAKTWERRTGRPRKAA